VLSAALHVPPEARDGSPVAVLLHGRGSHREDLQGLRGHLPTGTVLVTPEAPHPGGPWGYGPGWAWYRYVAEDRVEGGTLLASLEALDELLDGLPALLPVRPGPAVLGGFSQGGTTGLAWALTRPGRAAGVLLFSGFLVDDPSVPVDGDAGSSLEVFWGHGTKDPAIPHALAVRGRERLSRAGATVDARDYPIGHWIAPEELRDARAWLASRSGWSV